MRLRVPTLAVLLGLTAVASAEPAATCVGADDCRACKNCRYSRPCAQLRRFVSSIGGASLWRPLHIAGNERPNSY